jgi:hypothetical protein
MPTTVADIRGWLEDGRRNHAGHMIVMCDTFSDEDYPVYVEPYADVSQRVADLSHNMQKAMEVYALHLDWARQLSETRAWHLEPPRRINEAYGDGSVQPKS